MDHQITDDKTTEANDKILDATAVRERGGQAKSRPTRKGAVQAKKVKTKKPVRAKRSVKSTVINEETESVALQEADHSKMSRESNVNSDPAAIDTNKARAQPAQDGQTGEMAAPEPEQVAREPVDRPEGPAQTPADAPQDPASVLAQALGLFMADETTKYMFLNDLEWRLLPAVRYRQLRIWRREVTGKDQAGNEVKHHVPAICATWAMVSEETAKRLNGRPIGQRLIRPQEWKSGPIKVIIDIAAPNGGREWAENEVICNGSGERQNG